MKIFKKGFTIVEVLVALTILGIVTTILVPQLVSSINRKKSGAVLARAVAQIETGCRSILEKVNENSENEVVNALSLVQEKDLGLTTEDTPVILSDNLDKILSVFWDLKEIEHSGLNISTDDADETLVEKIKNGDFYKISNSTAEISITNSATAENITVEENESTHIEIFIDVNGFKNSNTVGKDIFYFTLNNNGKLKAMDEDTKKVVKKGYKIEY